MLLISHSIPRKDIIKCLWCHSHPQCSLLPWLLIEWSKIEKTEYMLNENDLLVSFMPQTCKHLQQQKPVATRPRGCSDVLCITFTFSHMVWILREPAAAAHSVYVALLAIWSRRYKADRFMLANALHRIWMESGTVSGIHELLHSVLVELCFRKTIYCKNCMLIHCKCNNQCIQTHLQYDINILWPSALYITTPLSMHHVSMVTWFHGVHAWMCVYTACMCSMNTARSEEENERMLKRWICTNGPDSISVPLQHQDSCANRHEGTYRIMPDKSKKKKRAHTNKLASFVLSLSLVSYVKGGREIHWHSQRVRQQWERQRQLPTSALWKDRKDRPRSAHSLLISCSF